MKSVNNSSHLAPKQTQLLLATSIILPCTLLLLILDLLPFLNNELNRGQVIGRDAFNFWIAGKLAIEGQVDAIYNHSAFMSAVRDMLGADAGLHVFPYPPPALLFTALFGWLPYGTTLLLWSVAGMLAFMLAATSWKTNHQLALLAALAPLSFCNIVLGQNGLLSAALFLGGLRLAHTRPILAGVLIGCLAFKPTLAILLPLALLVEKRWMVIISSAITLSILCVLPALIWGKSVWYDYLQHAVPFQQQLLEQGTGLAQLMKLTGFMSVKLLGFDNHLAYQIQSGFMLVSLALVFSYGVRRKVKNQFDGQDITLLAIATLLMLPYAHFYDMALITGGLLLMCHDNKLSDQSLFIRSKTFGVIYVIPIVGVLMNLIGLPITPIILLFGLALLCYAPLAPQPR
jgi:hypothetical protein